MNYYEILDIKVTATQEDIRIAYRKMAMKYHPDRNKGKTSDRMILINQAYETFSNPDKRKTYDIREGTGNSSHRTNGSTYTHTYKDEYDPFSGFGFDKASADKFYEDMMRG